MNGGAGWLHNTNSINNLILVHNKCGVWYRITQGSIIQRINGTRGCRFEGMNPSDNWQACKLNMCRYKGQVWWEDVTVQHMCVHVIPHHFAVVEIFDEVKVDNHL